MMLIGRYGGHFGNIWFQGVGNMSKTYSVKVKASNSKGATNERAIAVIIMLATKQDYSWHESDSRSSRQNNSSRLN